MQAGRRATVAGAQGNRRGQLATPSTPYSSATGHLASPLALTLRAHHGGASCCSTSRAWRTSGPSACRWNFCAQVWLIACKHARATACWQLFTQGLTFSSCTSPTGSARKAICSWRHPGTRSAVAAGAGLLACSMPSLAQHRSLNLSARSHVRHRTCTSPLHHSWQSKVFSFSVQCVPGFQPFSHSSHAH